MAQFYGQFLGWLQTIGDLDPEGDPVTQMTEDLVARFITERRAVVSDSNTYSNLRTLTMMMNCLAPEHDWTWIWRQGGAPRRREARAARRLPRLFPAGLLMHRLVAAMLEALAAPGGPPSATAFRDYLIVAVAVTTALRSRNLAEMRFGLNLVQRKTGWEIIYDGSEVKNGEAVLGRLPPVLDPFIERYINVERPHRLMGPGSSTDMVWISARAGALSPRNIWFIFARVGKAMLGYPINPHSVRHVAATRILDDDPRALNTASLALGHKKLSTASEFYDQSAPHAPQVVWLSLVDGIKSEASRTRARRTGRDP